jgi:hypothetical protein
MLAPSTSNPSRNGIDRRRLLSTLGATGSGAIAGCVDGADEPSEAEPVGTTRTSATATPKPRSRVGDEVFYDPDGDDKYSDGQAALADVPVGGTLVIGNGTWDVAEEGRLVVNHSVNIRGMGWPSRKETAGGTRIVNDGDDAIDKPAVEFQGPLDLSETNPRILGSLRELLVSHTGDAPAVRFKRAIRTTIADCDIRCRGQAPTGILYDHWGFFARALRNRVIGATDIAVHVAGNGYAHEFYSNHFASSGPGSIAFQTQRHRTILMGGECASTAEDGVGIRFKGPIRGGYVVEPGIENTDIGIDVGGNRGERVSGPVEDVQLYHVGLTREKVGAHFGNATGCRLIRPVPYDWGEREREGEASFDLVEWSQHADDCGVVASASSLEGETYEDHGAKDPFVLIESSASDERLNALPTGVPTVVGYGRDAGVPIIHDGSEWKRVSVESYTTTEG